MHAQGEIRPGGTLGLKVLRSDGSVETPLETAQEQSLTATPMRVLRFADVLEHGFPRKGLPVEVNEWRARNCWRLLLPWIRIRLARFFGIPTFYGALSLAIKRSDGSVVDLGLASLRVVTDTGATDIVDNLRGSVSDIASLKYHGLGTGTNAEAATDSALQTELTTQYNPDNTRATGSQTNNGAKVYRTVGTNTVDASVAATEHGIFNQAATGGGKLLDRSVFSVVNLASGDGIQSTYDFTVNSGG